MNWKLLRVGVIVAILAACLIQPLPAGATHTGNDFRSSAPLRPASDLGYLDDNVGAGPTAPTSSEDLHCDDDNVDFFATVWFRFVAPDTGTGVFSATGHPSFTNVAGTITYRTDLVLQVYRGSDTTPIKCSDDGGPGSFDPLVRVPVTAGQEYLIQAGSWCCYTDDIDPTSAGDETFWADGDFDFYARYERPDADGDGSSPPADCDDSNPNVRPGALEVVNNTLDDNCNGLRGYDRDRDGSITGDPNQDCNDANAAVHPGATDVPFSGVDEDCDGKPPRVPKVTAKVKFPYAFKNRTRSKFITAKSLALTGVTNGARVQVTCRRKGRSECADFGRTAAREPQARAAAKVSIKALHRKRLRRGTVVVVRVTKAGYVGRYFRFKVRKGGRSESEKCLNPGEKKPRTTCVTSAL